MILSRMSEYDVISATQPSALIFRVFEGIPLSKLQIQRAKKVKYLISVYSFSLRQYFVAKGLKIIKKTYLKESIGCVSKGPIFCKKHDTWNLDNWTLLIYDEQLILQKFVCYSTFMNECFHMGKINSIHASHDNKNGKNYAFLLKKRSPDF